MSLYLTSTHQRSLKKGGAKRDSYMIGFSHLPPSPFKKKKKKKPPNRTNTRVKKIGPHLFEEVRSHLLFQHLKDCHLQEKKLINKKVKRHNKTLPHLKYIWLLFLLLTFASKNEKSKKFILEQEQTTYLAN